jgi:hypothetical protein
LKSVRLLTMSIEIFDIPFAAYLTQQIFILRQ